MPSLSAKEKGKVEETKKQKRRELLKLATWSATLPPINNDDPRQIKARAGVYFDYCMKEGMTPGMEGLCNALGISRSTFRTWLNGSARKGQEHQKICQDIEQMLKAYMEGAMLDGDINPVPGIFFMSNQYDYVQKQVVSNTDNRSVLDTATPEQLQHRYGEGMIIDAIFSESPQKEPKKLPAKEPVKAQKKQQNAKTKKNN